MHRIAFWLVCLISHAAIAEIAVPPLGGHVNDLTSTLTAQQARALEDKLQAFEASKGSQLAVLIVPTTEPEDIAEFGIRVADQWKLGREKEDDGAILIVAKNDRRVRIEVGDGLEGALTDALSRRIIAETIVPRFKQGDFYGGIDAALDLMMRAAEGEGLPAPDPAWSQRPGIGQGLIFVVFAIFAAAAVLRAIFGRVVGAGLTGGAGALVAYVFTHILWIALLVAVGGFLFALLFGGAGGGRRWSSPGYRNTRGGGWGGGWGGGGFGGGGGFSGGGGGFSGGGASGSW